MDGEIKFANNRPNILAVNQNNILWLTNYSLLSLENNLRLQEPLHIGVSRQSICGYIQYLGT